MRQTSTKCGGPAIGLPRLRVDHGDARQTLNGVRRIRRACLFEVRHFAIDRRSPRVALKLEGLIPFEMTGIAFALLAPLARAGISAFLVPTYDTDYLLIKTDAFARSADVLRRTGYEVITLSIICDDDAVPHDVQAELRSRRHAFRSCSCRRMTRTTCSSRSRSSIARWKRCAPPVTS